MKAYMNAEIEGIITHNDSEREYVFEIMKTFLTDENKQLLEKN